MIRRHERRGGCDGYLELSGTIFRQKEIGRHPRRSQRGDEACAESPATTECTQAVSVAGSVLVPGV
jgi:hypothetical protein